MIFIDTSINFKFTIKFWKPDAPLTKFVCKICIGIA